jgi:predicted mannosyl-3-phosphoglycerate phosphatase (HAD superfamily)
MAVAVERRCEHCGTVLATTSRPDRQYCSASCRSAAYAARRRANAPRVTQLTAELEQVLARATEEPRLVAVIAAVAAKGNWRAAAWLLERRYPERWGARRSVQVELPPEPSADDPFAEVDQLRRQRLKRQGR